jgi:dolichol kinase
MMLHLILTILAVCTLLLVNEWWWHSRTHGEVSRKFVHITVGSFVAFWPLFLAWWQIELLSVAFVLVIVISKQLNLFKAIHSVQRPTWGEVFFGLAVGTVALVTHQPAIYAVALLHMSLADGLAAIIGTNYGNSSRYLVFGMHKSIIGTVTFAITSAILLLGFVAQQGIGMDLWLPVIVLGATIIENVSIKGLDNLLIPVFIAWVLTTVL